MRQRSAFTFIEVMITLAIVGILVGIFYPMIVDLEDVSQARVMQTTVRHIREKIEFHTALHDGPVSPEGFPTAVNAQWFPTGHVPLHAWTGQPMDVQIVHGPKTATEPNHKSFNHKADGSSAGHDAWYNASNGSFCALVPVKGSDAEVRGMFDLINKGDEGYYGARNGNKGKGGGDDDNDDDDDDNDDGDDD
ncbi:MAG: type II secretion system protein [Planctomycetota bacterium]|jgi:prepilin-type N-terminal cleavage/methylation domain-containing protein